MNHEHSGCVCMGINNSITLQGSWHLPYSRGADSRELASETIDRSCLLFLCLPNGRGVVFRFQPTRRPNRICINATATGGALVAEGLLEEATAIGNSGKTTTEMGSHSPLAAVYACTVSWGLIPGKNLMPTNQIRAMSARAHLFRELCTRALQGSRGI